MNSIKARVKKLELTASAKMQPSPITEFDANWLNAIIQEINDRPNRLGPPRIIDPLQPDAGPAGRFLHHLLIDRFGCVERSNPSR
jgi:hypothetical protein